MQRQSMFRVPVLQGLRWTNSWLICYQANRLSRVLQYSLRRPSSL